MQSSLTLTGVVVPGSNCYPRGVRTKVGSLRGVRPRVSTGVNVNVMVGT